MPYRPIAVSRPLPRLARFMEQNNGPGATPRTPIQASRALLVSAGRVNFILSVRPFPKTATLPASRSRSSRSRPRTSARRSPKSNRHRSSARSRMPLESFRLARASSMSRKPIRPGPRVSPIRFRLHPLDFQRPWDQSQGPAQLYQALRRAVSLRLIVLAASRRFIRCAL